MKKFCFMISSLLASAGMLLAGLVSQARAQWTEAYLTINRGVISHSILNAGMSGRRDNGQKQEPSSFSYPQGRSLLVYSGGGERVGWNSKSASAGEGFWVMSKTGGSVKLSYAGSGDISPDINSLGHSPSDYPEAYIGAVEHGEWAVSVRDANGARAAWTDNANLVNVTTSYWPASGPLESRTPPMGHPAIIWNFKFNRYRSGVPFTERIAAGEFQQLGAPAWAEALSEDEFPDVVAIAKAKSNTQDLQWMRRWYQWGHTDYDDIIINENVVENTGASQAEGVYIVLKNRFTSGMSYNWYAGGNANLGGGDVRCRDNYVRSTVASNYLEGVSVNDFMAGRGKPTGSSTGAALAQQGHAMVYLHDGDSKHTSFMHDDVGDPWIKALANSRWNSDQQWVNEGLLTHAAYFGLGVIDAIPPFNTYGGMDPEIYVAPHDNPETPNIDEGAQQPASITMWRFGSHGDFEQPDPGKDSETSIYDILTTAEYPDEPEEAFEYTQFVTFGPYDLQPGEKFKVVVAYVGGYGSQNAKYSDIKKYGRPFEFAWINLYNGAGRSIEDRYARQAEVPWGEAAMFENFQRAIHAYDWGYDLPNQPPNIRLAKESNLDGKSVISWSAYGEDSADPDYTGDEARDIRGYRIYRSKTENQGPFDLVAEFTIADAKAGANLPPGVTYNPNGVFHTVATSAFPEGIPLRANPLLSGNDAAAGEEVQGLYTYADPESKAGFPAWYRVDSYDSGHGDWKGRGAVPSLESAPGPGGAAIIGKTAGVVPVVPASDVFNRFEAEIMVVPNPFKVDDHTHSYKSQRNIRFINVPSRCKLEIFDVTGQKVWTQFNDDLTKGEMTWVQYTEGAPNQIESMFPGIYFWKVTNLMPGSAQWKIQTGTFAVIK